MTDTPQDQGPVPHYAADGTLKHFCSEGYCPDITDRQPLREAMCPNCEKLSAEWGDHKVCPNCESFEVSKW